MRDINKYGDTASFERITKPTAGRFRESTHHRPRNTKRDKRADAARLVETLEG